MSQTNFKCQWLKNFRMFIFLCGQDFRNTIFCKKCAKNTIQFVKKKHVRVFTKL